LVEKEEADSSAMNQDSEANSWFLFLKLSNLHKSFIFYFIFRKKKTCLICILFILQDFHINIFIFTK
jgi:hypothetical protein